MSQQHHFDLPFSPKPIPCVLSAPTKTLSEESSTPVKRSNITQQHVIAENKKKAPSPTSTSVLSISPTLIFTHGSGGTLSSPAMASFTIGFAAHLPILCFQGNMNLKSRIKMFDAVISARGHDCFCLGGRSMGARAAVMTAAAAAAQAAQVPASASTTTTHLVLVSYPLHSAGQGSVSIRDQILISLPPSMKVIFVSGDRDSMCDLERMEQVRAKMACKSWRVVISGADHGMKLRSPNAGKADDVVQQSGEIVAAWINESDEGKREGQIFFNEVGEIHWSGWCSGFPSQRQRDNEDINNTDTNIAPGESGVIPANNNRKALKRRKSSKTDDGEQPAGGGKVIKKGRKR